MKVFREGENVRVALQVNDGSAAQTLLDPPLPTGVPIPVGAVPGWQLPAGYIVRDGDTADGLSERFLGAPRRYSLLSNHAPVIGETLTLPGHAIPPWIGLATEPLPPIPAPKTWFTLTPNDIITALYSDGGDPSALQKTLSAIASPPDLAPDPAVVALSVSEALAGFAALPPDLIAAETLQTSTSTEGMGLDELVS
jgi:hypothetical protein